MNSDHINSRNPDRAQHSVRAPSAQSVSVGLRALAEETLSRKDRSALIRLADCIGRGDSLDELLGDESDLSKDLVAVVRSGIETGRLPELLQEYLSTSQTLRSMQQSLFLVLLYPFIIGVSVLILVGVLFAFVVPKFHEIFFDFGVELPAITALILALGDFVVAYWPFLIAAGVLMILMVFFGRYLPGRALRSRLWNLLPIVGTSRNLLSMSEFCSRMATLTDCQLPLHESLLMTSRSLSDPYYAQAVRQIAARVAAGETSDDLARTTTSLPHTLTSSFRWAKDPETYSESLRALSLILSAQARSLVTFLAVIIEPLVVIGVGSFVLFTILALFMPMIRLLNALS